VVNGASVALLGCKAPPRMDAPAGELTPGALASRRRLIDRIGDTALQVLTGAAALLSIVILGAIAYRLIYGAWPAINTAANEVTAVP